MCCKSEAEKSLSKEDLQKCLEQFLKSDDFPIKFYIALCIYASLVALTIITFQILSIVYKAPFYYVGAGIWGGLGLIIAAIVAYPFIHDRTLKSYKRMVIVGMTANLLTFPTMILSNLAYQKTDKSSPEYDLLWITWTMFGVLVPYKIFAITTRILTKIRTKKAYKKYAENIKNKEPVTFSSVQEA